MRFCSSGLVVTGRYAARVGSEILRRQINPSRTRYAYNMCVDKSLCQGNLGIPRRDMPQLEDRYPVRELLRRDPWKASKILASGGDLWANKPVRSLFLSHVGSPLDPVIVSPSSFKATQSELDSDKVLSMVDNYKSGSFPDLTTHPILVSSDGFVGDGHHRWAACLLLGESMNALISGLPIMETLHEAYAYPGVFREDSSGNRVPGSPHP